MKINDIVEIEKKNEESIHLFKEGIFWRCYEYSAWRFAQKIEGYRVIKKYIKALEQDVVYLGFPESVLNRINESYNLITKGENHKCIEGFFDKEGFESWKAEIGIGTYKPHRIEKPARFEAIIEKIKKYAITDKTPIEALIFLAEIKKEINGDL